MKRTRNFGSQRLTKAVCWEKPPKGWVKINCVVSVDKSSCGYFVRNTKGHFCGAGIYSKGEMYNDSLNELVKEMFMDGWSWSRTKGVERVLIESNDEECLKTELLPQIWNGAGRKCKKKVNCVAE